ncbi:signal peptidase I [Gilvimarinus sp. SDUM040013]|uniref:Signal peptidase I n=1 Tax=Gilvimarinus gilvus TaxID=3058038 RepID=A0ABU4RW02_9GAMM|nr:signal peptidase I [Gilvimarinus sp. SDUM040013]MDO3386484.1 signal peptidase I [Gilvimarinus sp. SDUM040013]MDX6849060.1 signal peptidase I [Gilvimarinus sp. SDUM040013]
MENINLPLILTIGVFFTGLVWLFDLLVLAGPRQRKIDAVESQFKERDVSSAHSKDRDLYNLAMDQAEREPVIVEYSKSFFPVLLIVFVLRSFIAEPFQIPSGSMEPTLDIGDFILVNKYTYGIRLPVINKKIIDINDPERGDVMVFFPPHLPDTYYIKRVVGLPGDLIRYESHQLFINGEPVPEQLQAALPAGAPQYRLVRETLGEHEFTSRKYIRPGQFSRRGAWRVPQGHYFMIGDNRDNSFDSRGWDDPFVPEDHIVGKAVAVWMHWDSLFSLPSFDRAGTIE